MKIVIRHINRITGILRKFILVNFFMVLIVIPVSANSMSYDQFHHSYSIFHNNFIKQECIPTTTIGSLVIRQNVTVSSGNIFFGASSSNAAEEGLANSGPIMRSLGAASKAEMLAKKLNLNINSPVTRQVLNSLDQTVESFINTYRKGSIKSVFPGEYLNMTVEDALRSGNTTVRKLLTDGRFVK